MRLNTIWVHALIGVILLSAVMAAMEKDRDFKTKEKLADKEFSVDEEEEILEIEKNVETIPTNKETETKESNIKTKKPTTDTVSKKEEKISINKKKVNDKLLDFKVTKKPINQKIKGKTENATLSTDISVKIADDIVGEDVSEAIEKIFTVNILTGSSGSIYFNGATLIYTFLWGVVFVIIGTAILCYWVGCEYKLPEPTTTTAAPFVGYGRLI